MSKRPYGKGKIVDWDTGYCFLHKKQFKGRIGLWSHVTRSKDHNKTKMKEHDLLIQAAAKKANAQKTLDFFIKRNLKEDNLSKLR